MGMLDGIAAEDLSGEPADVETPGQRSGRGFSDPEVLARAQETRRRNREANAPVSLDGAEMSGKPRGRPKGSGGSGKSTRGAELLLIGIHASLGKIAAHLTKEPELAELIQIDGDEAKLLAVAVQGCMEQFKIRVSEKTAAVMALSNAMGAVYGPRAVAIGILVSRKRANERNTNA